MSRVLKLTGIVIGAVFVLVIGVLLLLGLFVDPNDYKDQISSAVGDATGRTLTLDGDLELHVFPSLRIALGRAELSNAPGFGDAPFAQIESAELRLGLLALLFRRIEIDAARLRGLRLNLARNAAGTNNWQDFGGAADSDAAPVGEATAQGAGLDLNVGAIEIADAQVTWSDQTTGSRWLLDNFNMAASDFGPDVAFPLSMDFELAGEAVQAAVSTRMQANLALVDNVYRLADLEVLITGEGEGWPGGSGEAALRFDSFTANLDDETVDLENLELDFAGVSVNGTLAGRQLLSNLSLTGAIEIAPFDPRDVLDTFGQEIDTADAGAFREASASADLIYDANQLGLRNMELNLDDSKLAGSIGLVGDAMRFELEIDEINIDRYLPPATDDEAEPDEGSLDEVDLPLAVLRTVTASGELTLREAQFTGLKLTDALFSLNVVPGRLELKPSAALYGGTIGGTVTVDVEGDSARFGLVQDLENVDVLALARDYLDSEMISGRGNVSLDLTATGSNLGALRRQLDGDVSFTLRDGAWEGIDLWYELRRVRAVAGGDPVPSRDGPKRTPFSIVSATGVVEDALLTNRDLNATLPFMAVDGAGTVNLFTDEMDFDLSVRFIDGPALQSDPAMAGFADAELPLTIGGTLAEPSVLPDFAAIVRAQATEAVQELFEEEQEELRDRLRDRLRGIFD